MLNPSLFYFFLIVKLFNSGSDNKRQRGGENSSWNCAKKRKGARDPECSQPCIGFQMRSRRTTVIRPQSRNKSAHGGLGDSHLWTERPAQAEARSRETEGLVKTGNRCVCVCSRLYLLHIECQNTHSTSRMKTFVESEEISIWPHNFD